jgi:hypothetical protein
VSFDIFSRLIDPFRRQASADPAIELAFEAALTLRLTATLDFVSGPHGRWETSPACARTQARPVFGSAQGFAAGAIIGLALVLVGVSWLQHGGLNALIPAGSSGSVTASAATSSPAVVATSASYQAWTLPPCEPGHIPGPTACDVCICRSDVPIPGSTSTPPPTVGSSSITSVFGLRTPPPTTQPTFPSPIPS